MSNVTILLKVTIKSCNDGMVISDESKIRSKPRYLKTTENFFKSTFRDKRTNANPEVSPIKTTPNTANNL